MRCSAKVIRRFLVTSTLVFAAAGVSMAQGVDTSCRVAEVDISRLIKNDKAFKAAMTDIKAKVQTFEQQSQTAVEKIKRMSEQLESASDDERAELAAKVEAAKQAYNAKNKANRDLCFEQEALAYHAWFVKNSQTIETFAKDNGYTAVRRKGKSRKPRIPKDRMSILNAINSPYLYIDSQSNAIDITEEILSRIE